MQFRSIVVALAASSIGNVLAGPIPVAIDTDGKAMSLRDRAAVLARADQAQQAGQDQQAAQGTQDQQSQATANYDCWNCGGDSSWDAYWRYWQELAQKAQTQYDIWYNQANCDPGMLC